MLARNHERDATADDFTALKTQEAQLPAVDVQGHQARPHRLCVTKGNHRICIFFSFLRHHRLGLYKDSSTY